jgi:hypothetical protein
MGESITEVLLMTELACVCGKVTGSLGSDYYQRQKRLKDRGWTFTKTKRGREWVCQSCTKEYGMMARIKRGRPIDDDALELVRKLDDPEFCSRHLVKEQELIAG